MKDEYWGVTRKAVRILAEMGLESHCATPELVQLADRLLKSGQTGLAYYEREETPLLAEVAAALGECGRGPCWRSAHAALLRISRSEDESVRCAAKTAIGVLGDPDGRNVGKLVLVSNPFGCELRPYR